MPEGYTYFHGKQYTDRCDVFMTLRDCFDGDTRVKEQRTRYLPRPSGFPDGDAGSAMYAAYLSRALYYSVVEPTVRGLVGIVFEVPPTIELPQKLEPWLEAITPDGNSLLESASLTVQEVLLMGRHGLLLDLPREEGEHLPYISQYQAEDITNWTTVLRGGKRKLSKVVLRDACESTDDEDVQRFRELFLDFEGPEPVYRVRLWRCKGKGRSVEGLDSEVVTPMIRGKTISYIPFYFVGPYSNKPDLEKSPMLDLCTMAIKHFQLGADYFHALYMLAQPTPYIIGGDQDESWVPKSIGAGAFWLLPASVTRVDMLEFSGAGVSSQLDALNHLQEQMGSVGARLAMKQNVPETAEAVRVRLRHQVSVVESTVRSAGDAYRALLRDATEWVGANRDLTNFRMPQDFIASRLDPGMLSALIEACFTKHAISREVYHQNLQRGQIMPASRTIEDEQEAIEADKALSAPAERPAAVPPAAEPPETGDPEDAGEKEPA